MTPIGAPSPPVHDSLPHISSAHRGTAVLVFAKTAGADLCRRFRHLGARVQHQLGVGLQRQIRQQIMASGLPHVFSTEREQRGATYGQRLSNACADALALGYERLIVVGGDCPGLRARHLLAAAASLDDGEAVVGRDLRGGVYLFGFDASHTDSASLQRLPYRQPVLAKALTELLHVSANVEELEVLGDVHDVADLAREQSVFRDAGLRDVLRGLGAAFAKTEAAAPVTVPKRTDLVGDVGRRGPPVLV